MEDKVLILDFSEKYDPPTWFIRDADEFGRVCWFCKEDYNIYLPWKIKKMFFKKNTKLTEKKLQDNGFMKIESKTLEWECMWFFNFLGVPALKEFFLQYPIDEMYENLEDFVEMSDMEEEFFLVDDWLTYLVAIRWCKENNIAYKVKLFDGFPDTAKIKKIRKEMLRKIANTIYIEPFEALNKLE